MVTRLLSCLIISYSMILSGVGLLDTACIKNTLTHRAPFHDSHGAQDSYLGGGLLYYTLAYLKKANLCVCLGSGGGFVPRIMKQAQRDLGLATARTILVDGDMGDWGRPAWLNPKSFFRKTFPDVEIIIDTTHNVATNQGREWKIDYLHIDADHSKEGAWQDFQDYLPLMASKGIITIHDTGNGLPCGEVIPMLQQLGYEVINFKEIGAGVAVVRLP